MFFDDSASVPISSTAVRATLFNASQPKNAFSPKTLTDAGSVTNSSVLSSANALSAIAATGLPLCTDGIIMSPPFAEPLPVTI